MKIFALAITVIMTAMTLAAPTPPTSGLGATEDGRLKRSASAVTEQIVEETTNRTK